VRVCAVAQANDYAETLQAVPAQSFTYVLLCHNTCTDEYVPIGTRVPTCVMVLGHSLFNTIAR
jgi:hypothetical protein